MREDYSVEIPGDDERASFWDGTCIWRLRIGAICKIELAIDRHLMRFG
jgi:hypothetical protein